MTERCDLCLFIKHIVAGGTLVGHVAVFCAGRGSNNCRIAMGVCRFISLGLIILRLIVLGLIIFRLIVLGLIVFSLIVFRICRF